MWQVLLHAISQMLQNKGKYLLLIALLNSEKLKTSIFNLFLLYCGWTINDVSLKENGTANSPV